jgi:hypothetical protein
MLQTQYPFVEIRVEASPIRTFSDEAYQAQGIQVVEEVSSCDILLGVKEVPIEQLIPNKTYLFFSHTLKKQPNNRNLLAAILERKIRLVDYEAIRDKYRNRLIGFGRYAGIVGCYNGFLTYGLKHGLFYLKPAYQCTDRSEVERELAKVLLPQNFKCLLTGFGRVGHGASEIMQLLPIKEVSPEEYLTQTFDVPVYAQLEVEDYYLKSDGTFVKSEFYANPEGYRCILNEYTPSTDLYMPCHYWDNRASVMLCREDLINSPRLQVIADISCDVNGPIASTIRPSKIGDAFYGFDPVSGQETDYLSNGSIAVMAVDNLPCELPKDASEDFGNELLKHVFPRLLVEDIDGIIHKASETTFEGTLNEPFMYLSDYLEGR